MTTTESAYRDLFILNKKATNPLTLLRIIGSSAAAHVGIELGIKGPTFATCSACSTAKHAIGIGLDYIRNGLVDVAVTGASEAVLTFGSMRVWQAMRVLSPALACARCQWPSWQPWRCVGHWWCWVWSWRQRSAPRWCRPVERGCWQ